MRTFKRKTKAGKDQDPEGSEAMVRSTGFKPWPSYLFKMPKWGLLYLYSLEFQAQK